MRSRMTIKAYAKAEGVKTSAIYNRISRGKLESTFDGITWVYPKSDQTIKKPRK